MENWCGGWWCDEGASSRAVAGPADPLRGPLNLGVRRRPTSLDGGAADSPCDRHGGRTWVVGPGRCAASGAESQPWVRPVPNPALQRTRLRRAAELLAGLRIRRPPAPPADGAGFSLMPHHQCPVGAPACHGG